MNFFKEMVDSIEKRCIEVLLVDTENITYLYTNVWQLFNKLTCVCVCVCVSLVSMQQFLQLISFILFLLTDKVERI